MSGEVVRLNSLLHCTCAAFGHLWPEKRSKRNPRNVRCSACGMYLWALNCNGNEEFTDVEGGAAGASDLPHDDEANWIDQATNATNPWILQTSSSQSPHV